MKKSHTRQRGETRSPHPRRADDRHAKTVVLPPPPGGSLIGRRVGRSAEDVADALKRPEKKHGDLPIDTSAPGIAADDKKAGGGSTARRNSKKNAARAAVTLEDSATGTPSRKSTRRSANRQKAGTKLERRATERTTSPESVAARAGVRATRVRGGPRIS